jgi:uncharacterized membrane protein YkoI
MFKRPWLASLGAGLLLMAGVIATDSLASAAQQDATPGQIGEDEAVTIARAAYPGTTAQAVESEREGGLLLYEVELSNGVEVEIDAATGEIVDSEQGDDDEAGDDRNAQDDEGSGTLGRLRSGASSFRSFVGLADDDAPVAAGTLDDGEELLPQAEITLDQAVAAAQTASSGPVGEVDLDQDRGRLVFNVDVGTDDVKVDAKSGEVLGALPEETEEDEG